MTDLAKDLGVAKPVEEDVPRSTASKPVDGQWDKWEVDEEVIRPDFSHLRNGLLLVAFSCVLLVDLAYIERILGLLFFLEPPPAIRSSAYNGRLFRARRYMRPFFSENEFNLMSPAEVLNHYKFEVGRWKRRKQSNCSHCGKIFSRSTGKSKKQKLYC
jgi:hypothetical protein